MLDSLNCFVMKEKYIFSTSTQCIFSSLQQRGISFYGYLLIFTFLVGLVSNFKLKVLHLICGLSYILLTITVSMEQYLYKADQRAKWVI